MRSRTPPSSSSLVRTWVYSAIGAAPSSAASARMVRASSPSRATSSRAASRMPSRLRRSRRLTMAYIVLYSDPYTVRSTMEETGMRAFGKWIATFLGFPLGGYAAVELIGPAGEPGTALAAGALAGAVLGAAQWLALRGRGVGPMWRAATGTGVGLAQAAVLGRDGGAAAVTGPWAWAAVVAAAWPAAWLVSWSIGVDVERDYVVFGSSGALVFAALTFLPQAGRLRAAAPVRA